MSSRGGRGRRSNNGRRGGGGDSMAVDQPNGGGGFGSDQLQVPMLEVRNWEGGTMSDVIGFLERKGKTKLANAKQNGAIVSVQAPKEDVQRLEKLDGIRFAGNVLRLKVVYKPIGASPETSATITVLKSFLQSRYNPAAKLLNLTMMMSDPTLQSHGFLANPTTAVKMFQALMKLAGDNIPEVESVSLESNSLPNADLVLHVAETYPALLNLSLANNQLETVQSIAVLRNKLPMLRELVLAGNPVLQHPAFHTQINEIVAMFPRLVIVDGVTVRNEADLPKNALPAPIKTSFFEDESVASMTPMFLSNFFSLWDTNRPALLTLYDQASLFSLCYDSAAPHIVSSRVPSDSYIQISRNLSKNPGQNTRHNRIFIGPSSVASAFNRLPASKHNLENAEAFAIDAWKVTDIRVPGDTAIMMVVHGEFEETAGRRPKRSFDRTLVVLPGPSGSYIIASDMLTVRLHGVLPKPQASSPAAQAGQAIHATTPVAEPLASQGTPPTGPMSQVMPQGVTQPGQPSPADHAAMVQELMRQTGLTAEFAEMCLKEAGFNMQAALQLFQQSRQQLPPNAFQ